VQRIFHSPRAFVIEHISLILNNTDNDLGWSAAASHFKNALRAQDRSFLGEKHFYFIKDKDIFRRLSVSLRP